jgi:hypothetical protein
MGYRRYARTAWSSSDWCGLRGDRRLKAEAARNKMGSMGVPVVVQPILADPASAVTALQSFLMSTVAKKVMHMLVEALQLVIVFSVRSARAP